VCRAEVDGWRSAAPWVLCDYLRDIPGEAREYERLKQYLTALNGASGHESRQSTLAGHRNSAKES